MASAGETERARSRSRSYFFHIDPEPIFLSWVAKSSGVAGLLPCEESGTDLGARVGSAFVACNCGADAGWADLFAGVVMRPRMKPPALPTTKAAMATGHWREVIV